jgi:hypothetical protein
MKRLKIGQSSLFEERHFNLNPMKLMVKAADIRAAGENARGETPRVFVHLRRHSEDRRSQTRLRLKI